MRTIKYSIALAMIMLLLGSVPAMADTMNVAYRGNSNVQVWVDGQSRNAITAELIAGAKTYAGCGGISRHV